MGVGGYLCKQMRCNKKRDKERQSVAMNEMLVLFLTTLLGNELILPTFLLDTLVLLRVKRTRASISKMSFLPCEVVRKRTFHYFMLTGATENFKSLHAV